ncbi:MAG: alpha-galactosidase [Anaerolineaceae bacterium]|nr:alpha-galactosidase [Anaerolineaceae bacterium]
MDTTIKYLIQQPEIALSIHGKNILPIATDVNSTGIQLTYPHGIIARGEKTVHGRAVEWQWSLRNEGDLPTPPVSSFRPLFLQLPCDGRKAPRLHGSRGGLNDSCFPPVTLSLWEKTLITEGLPNPWNAQSGNGRSSNDDLPFFVLENLDRTGGYFIGIGWSGDWDLVMERDQETVIVHAGMTHLNLSLLPGETFRQPSILIGEYHGPAIEGFRALRGHLRDHVQPKHRGQPVLPITCFNNYYGDRGNFNADVFLREIKAAAEVGIDYLVIDGGWAGGGDDARWESLPEHIGNWERPAPNKFPHGFAPVLETAEQFGRKMGIWFDIEHAHPTSHAVAQHPELFFTGLLDNNGCHLLRLDLEAAREWAFDSICRIVDQLGGQYLKFDMNADPAPIWKQNDLPERRGATEIRYMENLYLLWEQLLEKYPDMLTENCASGGRRIDLEMIRHAHTSFLSDHSQSEAIIRYHIFGAGHFLPANHMGTGFAHKFLEPNRSIPWEGKIPAAAYLSLFGGNFILFDRAHELSETTRADLKTYMRHFNLTRKAFAGELSFIGRQSDTNDGVTGIAAVDPVSGARAAVLFGAAPEDAASYLPEGFTSLAAAGPKAGDMGNEQFCPAFLFYDLES